MNIHEYQAKKLFERFNVATPKGAPAETPEEAERVSCRTEHPKPCCQGSDPRRRTRKRDLYQRIQWRGKTLHDPCRSSRVGEKDVGSNSSHPMKIVEIAFTGYPVTDIQRARAFYEDVLKLESTRTFGSGDRHWIEYDLGPSTFAIKNMSSEDWKPSK
jgi:hypothetical protein